MVAEQDVKLVVLYADITGSTRLYETLGDTEAKTVVDAAIELLSAVTQRHRGRVVKTIGDEVMCTFPNAVYAIMAAGDMQNGIRDAGQSGQIPHGGVRITVGFHFGDVIEENGEVHGDTVHVASEMVKTAKPDQILTTGTTVDALPPELRISTRFFDKGAVMGRGGELEIHEVVWEVSGLTQVADIADRSRQRTTHSRLTLTFEGTELVLDAEHPSMTMGRSDLNDMLVPSPLASRQHASIDFHRGRFVLADKSANGTYLLPDTGAPVTLRREEHALNGTGKISLGAPADTQPDLLVSYSCE